MTSLRWRFPGLELLPGGTVTVTFNAQLAPGVAAGDTIINRAGGSADRDDLACATAAAGPGTATDDDDYGDGLFCTSASRSPPWPATRSGPRSGWPATRVSAG